MPDSAAVDLVDRPIDPSRRIFADRRTVRLGDVDRRGRLRLDATARFLQDVATDDANDAGLDRRFGWLVRRTMIVTSVPLRLGEPFEASTWCAATGRSWAERRSSLRGDRGGSVEAVSLWVQIDVEHGRPARLGPDFLDVYGPTAAGRTVSARLALPGPGDEVDEERPWTVRRTDLDPFGHVNNAANWAFLEEAAALDDGHVDRVGVAEMEHLQPVTHDMAPRVHVERREGRVTAWLLDGPDGSSVVSAARWTAGLGRFNGG